MVRSTSAADAVRGSEGDTASALPLRALTLRKMYDAVPDHDGRYVFTHDDYDRVERIDGVIIRLADAAVAALPADNLRDLDDLLPQFVSIGEDRLPASRPVARDQLTTAVQRAIVSKLEDGRLLAGQDARRAIALLRDQGLITTVPQRGSYVL